MTRNTFCAVFAAFAVCFGGHGSLWGQEPLLDSLRTSADSTALEEARPSAEEVLKAKVDSLRNAIPGSSAGRRSLSVERMLSAADSLRKQYEFSAAVDLLKRAAADADSTLTAAVEESLSLARNGLNMTGYCSRQTLVAKQVFPLEDFFLMYPMKDGVWHRTPNVLDSGEDRICQATYVPENADVLYFSTYDDNGIRDIFTTRSVDSLWTAPALVNENITSASDEIYPMLSPDGRTLYFASRGLYGMGGYDLYMSQWNNETQDWEQPVNMGFPFSSPYDDFLFINTDDGLYSIFASNRDCAPDSVQIYVLEYDALPARRAISDARELRELASLQPTRRKNVPETDPQDSGSGSYMKKMADVRELRDSVSRYGRELDGLRGLLTDLEPEEQSGHILLIQEKEQELTSMQERLDAAVKDLQEIELEFLSKGAIPDIAQDSDDALPTGSFEFVRHEYGKDIDLAVSSPDRSRDYDFSILPEGRFAENNAIPDGIVYQIQIAEAADRLSVEDLNGLSPVYDKMSTTLVHTYSVGVFRTYQDALSHLNSVRKAGFKDAFITANIDGHKVTVDAARAQENSLSR